MAVLSTIAVDWAQSPRLITVAAPVTSVSVQDLYDTLRDAEDEPVNMGFTHLISAGGKEVLDAALGSAVGITATLLNAVIKFEDRGSPTVCKISGGNIVAQDINTDPIDPIVFSTNVLAFVAQSSSATINDVSLTARLQHLLAGQDETHSPYGEVYYWDPVNGDDTADALLPSSARSTFASIHDDLCTGYTRDSVILLARDPSGTTIINETLVITKNHVLLSGPGRFACIRGADDSADTIVVDGAIGVEIDSIRVQTGPGPTAREAISVKNGSQHCKLSNLYLDVEPGEQITGAAIKIVGGSHHIIDNLFIQGATDDGVRLEDVTASRIERCKIFLSGADGIHLLATNPGDTGHVTLNDNVIQHSVAYDLQINTGVENTAIRFLNDITDANSILDNGTDTQWERLNQAKESAFWNWEETGGAHLVPGTTGFNAAAMSYMGALNIDTANGTAGTVFGTNGTVGNPVNNVADAIVLDAILKSRVYRLRGSITLTTAHDDWSFLGTGTETVVSIGGQDVQDSFFDGCELSGNAANSHIHAHDCTLDGLTNFSGILSQCRLRNSLSLAANSTMFAHCVSYVPGAGGTPILDVQGTGRTFQLRAYSGGIRIQNMSDAGNAGTIELVAGQVILDASCTDGDLAIRGIGSLTDNSAGTTINTDALLSNSNHQTPEVKQAWTRAIAGGSKMRATVALELDGQVITLPGTATLDVIVRDSAGTALIAQSGLTPNASGYFALEEDPFTPTAGVNLASFATITNGADVYQSLTPLSFPEFA